MSTSQAKIDANRRNSKKSTGPRTSAGKNRSRFNAVKHGGYASTWNRRLARYLGIGLTENTFGWNWATTRTSLPKVDGPLLMRPEASRQEQGRV
jgi:hypothetical protein